MDSDFGNDEFFDGMDKQTARELGLSAGDESTDYFLAMMKRAEIEKQLKAQVKKHGMDYGLDPVGTKDQDTARDLTENHYSRAQILVASRRDKQKIITCKQKIKAFFLVVQTPHPMGCRSEHHTPHTTLLETTPQGAPLCDTTP